MTQAAAAASPSPPGRSFAITGNPEAANLSILRKALEDRGLVERTAGADGSGVDVVFGPKSQLDYRGLRPPRMANHFEMDAELTTKSGLAASLKEATFCADVDPDSFYPACFFLTPEGLSDFEREFKVCQAACVLKAWVAHMDAGGAGDAIFEEGVVRVAHDVLSRRFGDVDALLGDDANPAEQGDFRVRSSEWSVLQAVEFARPAAPNAALEAQRREATRKRRSRRLVRSTTERVIQGLQVQAEHQAARSAAKHARRARERHHTLRVGATWSGSLERSGEGSPAATAAADASAAESGESDAAVERQEAGDAAPATASNTAAEAAVSPAAATAAATATAVAPPRDADTDDEAAEEALLSGARLLEAARHLDTVLRRWPQYGLCIQNLWILKPTGELAGHGISVERDLEQIGRKAQRFHYGGRLSYVAQKYIERPLLVGGSRKSDIRQWVLVTSFNPLTVWFFSELYVRVAASEFRLDSLDDRFTHLTHTTIACHHPNYDPTDDHWKCFFDMATYRRLVDELLGTDVWAEKVMPSMKRIVLASLLSVQEKITKAESSPCCFQVFGFDFMLDADGAVWLLEVNDIPTFHGLIPEQNELCEVMMQDMVSVVFDGEKGRSPGPRRFELMYRGPFVSLPRNMDGSRGLAVEGTTIHRPRASSKGSRQAKKTKKLRERREHELAELVEKRARRVQDQELRRTQLRKTRLPMLPVETTKPLFRQASEPTLTHGGGASANAGGGGASGASSHAGTSGLHHSHSAAVFTSTLRTPTTPAAAAAAAANGALLAHVAAADVAQ